MISNVFFVLRLLDFVLFEYKFWYLSYVHIVLEVIFITTLVTRRIWYDSFYLSAKPSTDGLVRELRFNFVFFFTNYWLAFSAYFIKKIVIVFKYYAGVYN